MADEAKLKGDEAFKQQDFETAVKHYTTAIEQNAINGTLAKHVLLSNRSACYCSLKKYDKALEDARNCTAANPAFAKGWSRKGAAMQGLRDLDGAAQAYKKAIEKDPNSACKADLARIEAQLGGGSKTPAYNQYASNPAASSSRPSTSASSGASYAMPTQGGSSYSEIKGQSALQAIIVVIQIATIAFTIGFAAIQDRGLGRHYFNRAVMAGLAGFAMHAVTVHGSPGMGTFMGMYKALRGTAVTSELDGIRKVAMDLNTHNAFYCTLLFSSNPSFLLLLPICLHSLTSIGAKGTLLVSKVAVIKAVATPLLKQITSRTADIARFSAQTEVGVFFILIFQLITPQRNFILIILYGQLLRVRFLVSDDSKVAWGNIATRADSVFLNARCPGIVQTGYNKVKTFVHGLGHPVPPA